MKMSFLVLLASFNSVVWANEISFLNNPSRIEIDGGTSQAIRAGETLVMKYDQSRLEVCSSTNAIYQSFLTASYSFDGGTVQTMQLSQNQPLVKASILVPRNARLMTIWFHNYSLQSPQGAPVCEAYDSNFGQNFNFRVQ